MAHYWSFYSPLFISSRCLLSIRYIRPFSTHSNAHNYAHGNAHSRPRGHAYSTLVVAIEDGTMQFRQKASTTVNIGFKDVHQQIMANIHNLSRPLFPYPGDDICPTSVQFNNAARMSHEHWASLGSDMTDCTSISCTADCILDLLRHVSAFYFQRSKTFSIFDSSFSQVKYAFEWMTTMDVICEQSVKRTYHYQILEIVKLVRYDFIYTSEFCSY